jgi:SAM-dependent methyltransferase/DNA-binding NarL/FixJ family response regulator
MININEPNVYNVAIVDDDKSIIKEKFQGLSSFTCEGKTFQCKHHRNPSKFIEQLTFLDETVDVVLLDMDFSECSADELKGISGEKDRMGIAILKALKRMDPAIPVLILSSIKDSKVVFSSGSAHADDYISKNEVIEETSKAVKENHKELVSLGRRIRRAWLSCAENPLYDSDHLKVANQFSENYEDAEQEKVATVAYYHFENQLILDTVRELLKNQRGVPLKILDLGCGTGRVEQLLASQPDIAKNVDVTATDFSPGMLRQFRKKLPELPHMNVLRGPVESFCTYESELPKNHFDLIIAGFGFLSYVNYKLVLPPAKNTVVGLGSLLRPGGQLLVSVYNEHSLAYDVIARSKFAKDELPVAAVVDLQTGILNVDRHRIVCDSFDLPRLTRTLRQAGLFLDASTVHSFPTLHLCLNNQEHDKGQKAGFVCGGDALFPKGVFSSQFFDQDVEASKYMGNRGHYWVALARRPLEECC